MNEKSPAPTIPRLTRWEWAICTALILASLGMYIRTLAPGLLYGDSAEFQTLAYRPGMTHPTGYSIYLGIGWLFAHFPWGNPAYNANTLSAVCAAISVGNVYLIGVLLANRRWTPVIGAAALAVSYTLWSQAVIAEIYTLGAATMTAILLLVLIWYRGDNHRWLAAAGALGGLSLGIHLTVALMAPAVLFILLVKRASRRAWQWAIAGALIGIIGWIVISFWFSHTNSDADYFTATVSPSISAWGMTADDVDSFPEKTRFLLEAKQFQGKMFALTWAEMSDELELFFAERVTDEFSGVALLLAGLGGIVVLSRDWRLGVFILLIFIAHLIYDINYTIDDISVFFIPTYVMIAIAVSVGASGIIDLAERISSLLPMLAKVPLSSVITMILAILAVAPVMGERTTALETGEATFIEEQYPMPLYNLDEPRERAESIVDGLPDNAVVLTDWGMLYPLYYVAHVERGRTDLRFIESMPQEGLELISDSMVDYIDVALAEGHAVYALDRPPGLNTVFRVRSARLSNGQRVYEVINR